MGELYGQKLHLHLLGCVGEVMWPLYVSEPRGRLRFFPSFLATSLNFGLHVQFSQVFEAIPILYAFRRLPKPEII